MQRQSTEEIIVFSTDGTETIGFPHAKIMTHDTYLTVYTKMNSK